MERFVKSDWFSTLNLREIAFYLFCCKKFQSSSNEDGVTEEERQPFMSKFNEAKSTDVPKQKHVEFMTIPDQRKRPQAIAMSNGRANLKSTVNFWVPDICGVQPEQEEYFSCQTESCYLTDSDTPVTTPTPRRRNTMPSSVYFRSPLPTADTHLSVEDIKPDLYHTTDWGAFGVARGDKSELECLGELIYKIELDETYRDNRVKIHVQSAVKLPSLPHTRELRVVIQNHADSRHVETINCSVEHNSVSINKVVYSSPGNSIQVTLFDPNCQDVLLAHGTATVTVNELNKPQSPLSEQICKVEKREKLSRKLNFVQTPSGSRLLVAVEHSRPSQNLYVDLRKIEFRDIARFCDKYVYVKATLYYRFKKIKSIKTPAILLRKTCLQYLINRQLTFVLASADLDELILVINLMERSLLRQDILLGREVLGPFLKNYSGEATVWGQLHESGNPVCYQCFL